MIVISVADATMKFVFGICDCILDSDASTRYLSLKLVILHAQIHILLGGGCTYDSSFIGILCSISCANSLVWLLSMSHFDSI